MDLLFLLHRKWVYFSGNGPGADTDIGSEEEEKGLLQHFEDTVAGVDIRFGRKYRKNIEPSEEKTCALDDEPYVYVPILRCGFNR